MYALMILVICNTKIRNFFYEKTSRRPGRRFRWQNTSWFAATKMIIEGKHRSSPLGHLYGQVVNIRLQSRIARRELVHVCLDGSDAGEHDA